MTLSVSVPPEEQLLDFDDVVLRQLLRLEGDEYENDELLRALCDTAQARAEVYTRRKFITQTLTLRLDRFSYCPILLGTGPVKEITSIRFLDYAGVWQTVPPTDYRLITSSEPAAVEPDFGKIWPVPRIGRDTVEINFVVGFGANQSAVPHDILHGVRMLTAHYFENRDSVRSGGLEEVPFGIKSQLDPWRIWI